jgi:hypothetical protein
VFHRHASALDEKYGHCPTAVAVAANVRKLMSGDGCDAARHKYHRVRRVLWPLSRRGYSVRRILSMRGPRESFEAIEPPSPERPEYVYLRVLNDVDGSAEVQVSRLRAFTA